MLIGHVGTFTYQKNQERLIELINKLKENNDRYKLVLVGDGEEKTNIQNMVKTLGLEQHVLFTGNICNVNEYLSAFDIMILPSRYEGLPLVSIEWQANGLPCIFSANITRKCKVLNNVKFVSLDEDDTVWIQNIYDLLKSGRIKDQNYIKNMMREKGFDIKLNAKYLESLYMSYMKG